MDLDKIGFASNSQTLKLDEVGANATKLRPAIDRIPLLDGPHLARLFDLLQAAAKQVARLEEKHDEKNNAQNQQSQQNALITTQGPLKDAVQVLESEMIRQGLIRTHWNKSLLARQLGISRTSLISKVQQYELEKVEQSER